MKSAPSSAKRKDTRYVQGGTTTVNEKNVGWWERNPELLKVSEDDIIIESLPAFYEGRPDLMSFDFYGNNNLEWVILQVNGIVDINEEFVTGARIRLPSKVRMFSNILTKTINYGNSDV